MILSMPTSYSQMGYKWGVFFHLFYVSIGVYTCYLLARLYVEYRTRKEREGVDFSTHVIQVGSSDSCISFIMLAAFANFCNQFLQVL